jgi:hypothetical protein
MVTLLRCTGRPPAISDDDIEVDFPIDIDEDVNDLESLQEAVKNRTDSVVPRPSSLTPFIHFLKLRRIESRIEHDIYRVKRQITTTPSIVQDFLSQLILWKNGISPQYYAQVDSTRDRPHVGIDVFVSKRQTLLTVRD